MNEKGFTIIETVTTAVIVSILAAVAFVSVVRYRKILTQKEWDAVAKEIFVAAQNHAEMEGAQIGDDFGEPYGDGYLLAVNGGNGLDGVLAALLPFGSIDETVRAGGNFLIHYQPPGDYSSARMLDVFYSGSHTFGQDEADALMGIRGDEAARREYAGGIIGWYGGAEAETLEKGKLKDPVLRVDNNEYLKARVEDDNTEGSLRLIITGEQSGAQAYATLRGDTDDLDLSPAAVDTVRKAVTLDDITDPSLKFAELFAGTRSLLWGKQFIPGENLCIQAVAYNNDILSNVASSPKIHTNSLFGDLRKDEETDLPEGPYHRCALLWNIRHLENLDDAISKLEHEELKVTHAEQASDISWPDFTEKTDAPVYKGDEPAKAYIPVFPTFVSYDGKKHTIEGIEAESDDEAGVFSVIAGKEDAVVSVSNLVLSGCTVNSGKDGGTLAGITEHVEIMNVMAVDGSRTPGLVEGACTGGLVGHGSYTDFSHSSASVRVRGKEESGGLVGKNKGDLEACYSGGHTENGKYKDSGDEDHADFDVVSETVAGGLTGSCDGKIRSCYSTCSAAGAKAAGLAVSSGKVSNCYAVGLVGGEEKYAFHAGDAETEDCHYYRIVNGPGVEAVPEGAGDVNAMDADAKAYNEFFGHERAKAVPYDDTLGKSFPFPTAVQLEKAAGGEDGKWKKAFVAAHFGDWPDETQKAENRKTE